ncbi:MAG: serine protease, partial [Candidatus Omnitrophica bacterium]|nr:serine protease [Candidatus Omnitrophota bacterium]
GLSEVFTKRVFAYVKTKEAIAENMELAKRVGRITTDKLDFYLNRHAQEIPLTLAEIIGLLKGNKYLYEAIFYLAYLAYQNTRDPNRPKYIEAMRDAIISHNLTHRALVEEMEEEADKKLQVDGFRMFYEDYRHHLPGQVGVEVNSIKGLDEAFTQFTAELYQEFAKVAVVESKKAEEYDLTPAGFISIFRGIAGIVDCSFDGGQGHPWTRAMHEDTVYYFVYRNKVLRGYVGLCEAKTQEKQKILTIDAIQSPLLDGEELLRKLLQELLRVGKDKGFEGLALPVKDKLIASFNFRNQGTTVAMPEYRDGMPIELRPIHARSWGYFRKMFGLDKSNSIEYPDFILLKMKTEMPYQAGQLPVGDNHLVLLPHCDNGGEEDKSGNLSASFDFKRFCEEVQLHRDPPRHLCPIERIDRQLSILAHLADVGVAREDLARENFLASAIPLLVSGTEGGSLEKVGVSFFFEEDKNFYYGLTAGHVASNIEGLRFGLQINNKLVMAEGLKVDLSGYGPAFASSFGCSQEAEDFAFFRVSKENLRGEGVAPIIFRLADQPDVIKSETPVIAFGIVHPYDRNECIFGMGVGCAAVSEYSKYIEIKYRAVSPGFSGSPIISLKTGDVLGINREGTEVGFEKTSFAISASEIKKWVKRVCQEKGIEIEIKGDSCVLPTAAPEDPTDPRRAKPMNNDKEKNNFCDNGGDLENSKAAKEANRSALETITYYPGTRRVDTIRYKNTIYYYCQTGPALRVKTPSGDG